MLNRFHTVAKYSPEGAKYTRKQRREKALWDVLDQLGPNETLIMLSNELNETTSSTIGEYVKNMTARQWSDFIVQFPMAADPRWLKAWGNRLPEEYIAYHKMVREIRRVRHEEKKHKRRSRRASKLFELFFSLTNNISLM